MAYKNIFIYLITILIIFHFYIDIRIKNTIVCKNHLIFRLKTFSRLPKTGIESTKIGISKIRNYPLEMNLFEKDIFANVQKR